MNYQPVTIIAEAGINWFGNMSLAHEMIVFSRAAKADIIKFQLYRPEELLGKDSPYLAEAIAGVPTEDQARQFKQWADEEGIEICFSVFHSDIIKFTEELGVKRYKIGSKSIEDLKLFKAINRTKKPVFISVPVERVGLERIYQAIRTLRDCPDITLMYCVPNYPTSVSSVCLGYVDFLHNVGQKFSRVKRAGFSSHCPDNLPTLISVVKGAKVVENHIVKDRSFKGCDVSSSLTFNEFEEMTKKIRIVEEMIKW